MTEERPAPDADDQDGFAETTEQPEAEPILEPKAEDEPTPEPAAEPETAVAAEEDVPDTDGLDGDVVAEAAIPKPAAASKRRGRRVLAAAFWLLASLSVLVGGVALWAHQTLLTADGWGGIVEDVISQEEVTEALSVVIVDRLSESLAVRDVVADVIPGPDIIAGAVTGVVEQRVVDIVEEAVSSEAFQTAFVNVNKAAHDATLAVIRGGDSEALTSEEGVIAINVFPIVESVLIGLQEAGLIDESREIPDLTEYEVSSSAISALETLLDRELPDDLGTIVLVESENLELVQTVIRWFDLITIVMVLAWILFTALALWFSRKRVRMVLWLSGGAIAALLTARLVTRVVLGALMRNNPELQERVVVEAIIDAAVDSLLFYTFVLLVIAVLVGAVAYFYERRDQLRPSMETPPRTLAGWVKRFAWVILAVGVGIVGIIALWSVAGAGAAMLCTAAILLLAIAVKVISDQSDEDEPGTATEG